MLAIGTNAKPTAAKATQSLNIPALGTYLLP